MYSSEDLEKFYFQYQIEDLPRGESLQSFCIKNKVPYNIFQKWYKDTHKKVVEVKVDGIPVDEDEPYPISVVKLQETSPATNSPIRIWIDVHISNGLHLSRKNLSHRELVRMVESLKGLC